MSKKVIPVLCEGQSDLIALESYLDDIFSDCDVKFVITSGDFLGDETKYNEDLNKLIEESIFCNNVTNIDFTYDDILMVAHLIDTDGVFESDEILSLDENEKHTKYYDNKIVVCNSVPIAIERRSKRRERINDCIKTSNVLINNKFFPYSIYYMSSNLEDVTWEEKNVPSAKEKIALAKNFSIRYENSEDFIKFLESVNCSRTTDYLKSWNYIKKHSLKRSTNLIIFINKVKEMLSK